MKKSIKVLDTGTGFIIEGYSNEMFKYKDANWRKLSIKMIEEKAKNKGLSILWEK